MNNKLIGLGCMRIAKLKLNELEKLIKVALENGITLFDHADIYGARKIEHVVNNQIENQIIKELICNQRKINIETIH